MDREKLIAQTVTDVQGFAEHCAAVATERKQDAIPPMMGICVVEDDKMQVKITSATAFHKDERGKNMLAHILRSVWDNPAVEVTFHMSEAWALVGEKDEVEQHMKSGKSISESEQKQEILMLNIATRHKQWMISWPIAHACGVTTLGEKKVMEFDVHGIGAKSGEHIAGRFVTAPEPVPPKSQMN